MVAIVKRVRVSSSTVFDPVIIGFFGIAEGQKTAVEVEEPATKTSLRNNWNTHHRGHKVHKRGCRNNRMVHSCTANTSTHTRYHILLFAPGFAILSN